MKTIMVGDTHLKQRAILPLVDDAVRLAQAQRVVFLGDYTDEWGSSDLEATDALGFLAEWVGQRRSEGLDVTLLLGNHDFQYLLREEGAGTHTRIMGRIRETLLSLGPVMATEVDGWLATHAGLTASWCAYFLEDPLPANAVEAAETLNDLYADEGTWGVLASCGAARGGMWYPGPLWADASELSVDHVPGIPQIVGHTPMATCTRISEPDPVIWACDTFSRTRRGYAIGDWSLLIVEDGVARPMESVC